jgi:hypothetical protein
MVWCHLKCQRKEPISEAYFLSDLIGYKNGPRDEGRGRGRHGYSGMVQGILLYDKTNVSVVLGRVKGSCSCQSNQAIANDERGSIRSATALTN